MIRVLIVDDEPLARRTLHDFLAAVPWIEIVGEAGDGLSAIAAIDRKLPDLVFLDVIMPGVDGLETLRRSRHHPHVVFTTAHDRFAVTAFEVGAVDYLLKPFSRDRLMVVLERVRTAVPGGEDSSRLTQLMSPGPLERLYVREGSRVVPLPVTQIERLEARDDYVAVHTGQRRYLVSVRMKDLVARLDPARFVQVHRSHVINLDQVLAFEVYDRTRLQVAFRSGVRIVASRPGTQVLRGMIGRSGIPH